MWCSKNDRRVVLWSLWRQNTFLYIIPLINIKVYLLMCKPVTVEEYRRIIGDHSTSSHEIQTKLDYMVGMFRNIIRTEKDKYVNAHKKNKDYN
jgi:hypothetical protein